jgi:hypothetical protein
MFSVVLQRTGPDAQLGIVVDSVDEGLLITVRRCCVRLAIIICLLTSLFANQYIYVIPAATNLKEHCPWKHCWPGRTRQCGGHNCGDQRRPSGTASLLSHM